MGKMKIMSPIEGDKLISWDLEDPKSVERAKKKFEAHIQAGHKAYKVKQEPRPSGTPVKTFNPKAEEYLLVPATAGG